MNALIEAARAALSELDAIQPQNMGAHVYRAREDLRTALAAAEAQPATAGWDGTEEWEALAWHLCAEENGEDACNELVWEGGPMPEPWGDRWLKYEGAAKDMIARVRKFAPQPAARPLTDAQVFASEDFMAANGLYWGLHMTTLMSIVRCVERHHGIGSQP